MPSNPIQRKTRNSFFLGMLIMLLIAVAGLAVLYFAFFGEILTEIQDKGEGGSVLAYRLTADIKSGEAIKQNKIEAVNLYVDDLPKDYIPATTNLSSYQSKVDLKAGTVISESLVREEKLQNSTRIMEYNMITLPSTLSVGDYIDIRLTMPSGQDYIVLSKKQVMNITNTTITLHMTEDEILMMSSAIIESYVMKASNLYAVQYIEAGIQDDATPTYYVNAEVYQLIMSNSEKGINIEDYSKINASHNKESEVLRQAIEQELGLYAASQSTNIEEKMEEQKNTSMELYLSGLAGF